MKYDQIAEQVIWSHQPFLTANLALYDAVATVVAVATEVAVVVAADFASNPAVAAADNPSQRPPEIAQLSDLRTR